MVLNENRILFILVLGTLMGAVDTTIVLLAIPAMTQGLHTGLATTIWTIIIYLLVLAVSTTQLGRIGDMYGRSKMFNVGFAVFTFGSLLCGLAPSGGALVGFRALQAIGGALVEANSGAIIADTFARDRRGRAYGYTSLGWSIGAVLGIVLGGIITTFVGWRFIFLVNVPIGIAATILGFRYVKDKNITRAKMDLPGMATLGAALGLISYGLVNFASIGANTLNMAMVGVGGILIPVFIYIESIAASPMINLNAFKHKVLRYSIFASFLQALAYLSVTFLIIMYLQGIRGLSPFYAALVLVPGYIVSSILAPKMGKLSDKIGARILATVGIALMAATVLVYLTLTVSSSLYIIIGATIISGIGSAMFWPANSSAVMAHASQESHGSVSGLLRTMGSIGTLGSYVLSITAASLAVSRTTAFKIFIGTSTLIGGVSQKFLVGIDAALIVSFVLLVIAGLLSSFRGKDERSAPQHEHHEKNEKK